MRGGCRGGIEPLRGGRIDRPLTEDAGGNAPTTQSNRVKYPLRIGIDRIWVERGSAYDVAARVSYRVNGGAEAVPDAIIEIVTSFVCHAVDQ